MGDYIISKWPFYVIFFFFFNWWKWASIAKGSWCGSASFSKVSRGEWLFCRKGVNSKSVLLFISIILAFYPFSCFDFFFQKHYFSWPYLIRTPVPHGGDGHADDDTRPRQVRVHRIPEDVEGICSRNTAGCVWNTDRRYGLKISLHQRVPASNFSEASTSNTSIRLSGLKTGGDERVSCSSVSFDSLKPMRVRDPANMMRVWAASV